MLLLFALCLTTLLGFSGLAVDIGRIELRKIELQSAADAAVLSSTTELEAGNVLWPLAADAEVASLANQNGYPAPTVAVQQTANYGDYVGDTSTVQVTLTQQMPTYFLQILGSSTKTMNLTVRAVALQSSGSTVVLVQ